MHKPNITLQQLHALLAQAEVLHLSVKAQQKLAWFVHYLEHGKTAAATCAHFGISRATFQRWLDRFDPLDVSTLEERSHQPHTIRQSAVPAEVVAFIREYRKNNPRLGKEKIADTLWQEKQILLSASTVGRIIERENLYFDGTPLHWKKRVQRTEGIAPVQAPEPATTPAPEPQENTSAHAAPLPRPIQDTPVPLRDCTCLLCRMHRWNWKAALSGFFVVSVLVNLILLLSLFANFREQGQVERTHASAPEWSTELPSSDLPTPDER